MPTPLISHPFRLAPNGYVFTYDQSDDEYIAERIAILCTTITGERPLVPGYGIADPVFAGFDENILRTQLDIYGPFVDVADVVINPITDSLEQVTVSFAVLQDTSNEGEEVV